MTKTNVLIVEDEIIVAKNIEAMLKVLDYDVAGICISGEQAIKVVAEKKPDLILMDIVLGDDIDGIQAAAKILEEVTVPIIFVTSYSDDDNLKRAKETAPYGYIIKPIQEKELLAGIEIALERYNLEQKIRENEQLLQTTLRSISDGIITTDKKGHILYINNIGEKIIGRSYQDIKGKSLNSVFKLIYDDTNKELCKFIENPSRVKKLTKIPPSTIIPKIDSTKIIDGSISPILETTGKTRGSVLVFRDITAAQKALKVQNALYNISNAVNTVENIQELLQSIQKHLGEIIDTKNFYVALYDKKTDTISLPYIIDKEDKFTSFPAGKTLTGYVIKHKKPILVDEKNYRKMSAKGLIEIVGSPSKVWMGVPLRVEGEVIGVVAVQSYEDENLYTKDDLEILEFVSGQLAIAISHKHAEDAQRIERAYFEQLFENSPEAIVLVNNESRILRLNEEFTKTFGYTIEEARNKNIDELLTRDEYEKEVKNTTAKIAKGETIALESIRWHKNGTPVDVSILGTPIIFEGGQLAIYGIYRNISDRKIAEEALKQRTEELNDRVKELNCLYKISDIVEDPEISMRAILNESLEIIAQSWKYPEITYVQILWGDDEYKTENFEETNWHLSQNILAYSRVMGTIQVGYLEERPEYFIGPFSEEESNLLRAIAYQLGRIGERKLAEDELKEANIKLKLLARTDPLTQLSNRRDALEKIEYEEKRYERSKKPFAIIICDIDDFKSVNDRFGHDAGDEVLKTLANIMRMIVRKQDIVARWGGEEFLLMLPQTDIEGGLVLAEKIRKKVRSTEFNFNGMKIHISLTMGLSIYKESKTIDETISQADRALYMGKKLGKDCVKSETDLIK